MPVQMTCPYCKREFPYDNGWIDRDISVKCQRITEINNRLAEIKALGRERWDKYTWKRRCSLVKELTGLQTEVTHLKSIRKACDQQLNQYRMQHIKMYVKERFGEDAFQSIMDAVEEDLKAYTVESLMRREYTKAPGRSTVTNISKL